MMIKKTLPYLKHYIWDIILYACLGCFSYFFLIRFSDIPIRHQDRLFNLNVFLAVIFLFSCLGLGVRYVNNKLMHYYQFFIKNRKAMIIAFIITASVLFIYNYLLMVFSKWIVEAENPFALKAKGISLILLVWLVEIIIVGQFILNHFYADLVRLYKHAEELEKSNAQAKYTALQNQLNPHFLFNSLNTLISEIEYSPSSAIEFTRNLSDIYRYILLCNEKSAVPLYEEMEFIYKYIELHKVRLGDCIIIKEEIDESLLDNDMPPLTLQLLVENIIKHNVINMTCPMTISIYTEYINDEIWMVISNPIRSKKDNAITGKGLVNLAQRFKLLTNRNIIIDKNNYTFTVKLPLEI